MAFISQLKSKLVPIAKWLRGDEKHLKLQVQCDAKWYGNRYGGFFIHPELLRPDSIVYSFGIGEDITFDEAIIQKHGCDVFGFDPTPKSIRWVKQNNRSEHFKFFEFGLGATSGAVDFFLPKNPDYVSGSVLLKDHVSEKERVTVQLKSLADTMVQLGHSHIDVLKMDIEGAEYNVIAALGKTDISIDQILIEFHDRFFENGLAKTKASIDILKSKGYAVFAVSESKEEISFIRKSLISG